MNHRVFRLDLIYAALHNAALNQHRVFFEIKVPPLETHDLANAQSQALRDQHHRAVRFPRREAERRGLSVIGTIGVLREAADEGLLDLRTSVERLR